MAFQNISTPRIYLNIPEYLASTGTTIDPVFRTLPVSANTFTGTTLTFPSGILGTKCFIAVLGHTLKTNNFNYTVTTNDVDEEEVPTVEALTDVINGTPASGLDGFSISTFAGGGTSLTIGITDQSDESSGTLGDIGTVSTGIYYDFPHSPDLNLSLSYEYGGIKETTTKGGATLTNQFYNKPPSWGSLGAWELGGTAKYAKSGRRVWDLSFSYLSDSSVFPDNAGLVNETSTTDTTGSGATDLPLLEDDSFQRVIHLTNGGQIPFIFQSDNTVSDPLPKPDQLAIAKFDMNSFKFEQVANGVYNVKLKIREVW